jgi:hypothetical protein
MAKEPETDGDRNRDGHRDDYVSPSERGEADAQSSKGSSSGKREGKAGGG